MTDEEFLIQLREAFAVEAAEHLQAMTSGLLALERAPDASQRKELTETIFREMHSLKGAAGAVSRTDIQTLCQELESIFSEWKRQPVPVAAETFDTLNRAVDLLDRLLKFPGVPTGATEQQDVTAMAASLAEVLRQKAPAPLPPAAEAEAKPSSAAKARKPKKVTAAVLRLDPAPSPPAASTAARDPAPTTGAPVEPATQDGEGPHLSETVRIRMPKMDSLLRKAEEMVSVKLTASQHATELRAFGTALDEWRKEWAKVRDLTRSGLAGQNAAALEKVGGFLLWNQGYMRSLEKRLSLLTSTAQRDERSIGMLVDDLLGDAKRLVMLPCGTLLDMLPRLVRDLSRLGGKEVTLTLGGREVEIDKRILQEMKDPLIHLVRNSVDHGLEKPAVREGAHKPPCGTISVTVAQRNAGKIEIVVSDDGAGINLEMVRASAIRAGTLSAEDAAELDEPSTLAHIFDSGVSTSPIITEISGRGLGMAIVREKVEGLGGTISIESAPGKGTTFRIILPVTLATFKGILVGAGGQRFVIPTANVERIKRIRREDIMTVENTETMSLGDQTISFVRLGDVLELIPQPREEQDGFLEVVVLGSGDKRIGFAVDDLFNEQEVLVKSLGKPLVRVRNVAGATVLGNGTPAVILHAADLLKSAVRLAGTGRHNSPVAPQAKRETQVRRILVADDSVTSRMLLKNILESSGYHVTTAIDGAEALATVKSHPFDVVVSDVEMPRMDGFELTTHIRADKKLAELPVVLVTALASREHQERGIDAGANAYIVKGSFDQSNLLDVIRKLV